MSVSTAQCYPITHSSKVYLGLWITRISTVTANSAVYASCWSFTTPSVQDRHKIIQASLTACDTSSSFDILFLQWAVSLQIKRSSSPWFWRVYSTVADPNLLDYWQTRVRNIHRYVWLHFVGPHLRKTRSNKHEAAVARTCTLCPSYSSESNFWIYSFNRSYARLRSSNWSSSHMWLWRLSPHTEMHPVALRLMSLIYRVRITSSDLRFTLYKLCWVTSAW